MAVPPVRRRRKEDGGIQESWWQAAKKVGVSVTGDDVGFRSMIGSSSRRSSGFLQNTQKEMRLLLLQWKSESSSPCDLTSY
jgi:hypothetical protein